MTNYNVYTVHEFSRMILTHETDCVTLINSPGNFETYDFKTVQSLKMAVRCSESGQNLDGLSGIILNLLERCKREKC